MAIINGVDILDTNIRWFGGGSAAPAIELIRSSVSAWESKLTSIWKPWAVSAPDFEARKELAQFDLNKDNMPRPFDPLTDKLPP